MAIYRSFWRRNLERTIKKYRSTALPAFERFKSVCIINQCFHHLSCLPTYLFISLKIVLPCWLHSLDQHDIQNINSGDKTQSGNFCLLFSRIIAKSFYKTAFFTPASLFSFYFESPRYTNFQYCLRGCVLCFYPA